MKNLKTLLFAALIFALAGSVNAQSVGINADGSTPNASAMLDVNSTTKGFLAPRLTAAQKAAIALKAICFDHFKAEVENLKKAVYGNTTVQK